MRDSDWTSGNGAQRYFEELKNLLKVLLLSGLSDSPESFPTIPTRAEGPRITPFRFSTTPSRSALFQKLQNVLTNLQNVFSKNAKRFAQV